MSVTIKFDTENDCFQGSLEEHEMAVSKVIEGIANNLQNGTFAFGFYMTIHDENGNDIGRWKIDHYPA